VSAVLAVALAAVALFAPPRPHIVWKPIPFGPTRLAQTTAYARRHYGIDTHVLRPRAIVEHVTATPTFASAYDTFAADVPDAELHQLPGTCAHFIIDRDGTIYQLVRLNIICRHTVGLNWTAIGVEHVGESDADVLGDARQMRSSLALTLWLMSRYHIRLENVIGHNESLSSPLHKELYAPWRCQTHADWRRADMDVYRAELVALARRYGLRPGPPPRVRATGC
jgi:N-acetylmuramoyl-L-alanine amidase